MILVLVLAVFAFFFVYGVLSFLKAVLAGSAELPQPRYAFRFTGESSTNTVRNIPPGATFETSAACPFCHRPAKVIATRDGVRIECADCGVLQGTADVPGVGVYSIPVPKGPNIESV